MQPIDFLKLGIAVIPVTYREKRPSIRWQRYQNQLPSERDLLFWSRRPTNYAVVCGWQGLTVLDFDNMQNYLAWQAWAIAENEVAREVAFITYRVKTARGVHVYVMVDDTPRTGHFRWGDIKAKGGYVLIPPSVHPSGAIYQAYYGNDAPILKVDSLDDVIPDPPAASVPIPPTINVYPSSSLWPQTIIEEIKERIPILSLLSDPQKTGDHWYMCKCPLHDDGKPSMWIDERRGICGCYTGCNNGKPMDVISLYGQLHGLDTKKAVKELAGKL